VVVTDGHHWFDRCRLHRRWGSQLEGFCNFHGPPQSFASGRTVPQRRVFNRHPPRLRVGRDPSQLLHEARRRGARRSLIRAHISKRADSARRRLGPLNCDWRRLQTCVLGVQCGSCVVSQRRWQSLLHTGRLL